MLRVVAHTSAAAARKYYAEGLKREDYYSEKQEVVGKWHGRAAGLLGLSGDVDREQFAALVENRNPLTGEKLTPRTKEGRRNRYEVHGDIPLRHPLERDHNVGELLVTLGRFDRPKARRQPGAPKVGPKSTRQK